MEGLSDRRSVMLNPLPAQEQDVPVAAACAELTPRRWLRLKQIRALLGVAVTSRRSPELFLTGAVPNPDVTATYAVTGV